MLAGPIGIRVSGNDSGLPAAEAPRAFDLVVAFWEEDSRTQIAQPSLPRGRPTPDGALEDEAGEDGAAEDGAAGLQEEVGALTALDLQQLLDRIDETLARQQADGQDGAGQGDETLSLAILLAALFPEADSLAELEALLKAELQILAEQPAETLSGGSVLVAAHPDDPIAELVERGLATLEESALAEGFDVRLLEEGPFADPGVLDPAPGRGEPGLPAPGTGGSVYSDLYSDLGTGLSPSGETLRPSDVLSGVAVRVESAPQARRYDGGGDASAEGSNTPASHAPVAGNDSYAKAAHLFEASFDSGLDGFGYHDDAFRGTAQPGYADGVRLGAGGFSGSGGLQVTTGGLDNNVILGMSGGWERSFNLAAATDVTLTFRYRLTQDGEFEADEYSEALVAVDGTLHGNGGNDYLARISGNGNGGADQTTGWQTFTVDLGPLAPGAHTVTIGAHNNKKTFNDEFTWVLIDEVAASDDNPLVVDAASGLLANDSDLDGGLLTAALLSGPADGLLALNADGSFTYTPDAGFIGLDSFTYTVSDGSLTDNGTATIAVGNVVQGSAAGEVLTGTAGRDALYGFDGNDTLTGGAGNDRLQGGSGKDTLTGGTGADVFAYESGDGGAVLTAADLVTDFEDGSDLIGLDGALSGLSIGGGGLAISNNGGDAVVTVVGSGEFLTVIDGAFGLITDTDFLHL